MMWREERLWNVGVLQRVDLSSRVTLDIIVAFVIPLVALMMSSPVMRREEHL
jgi:hypothetical protein